MTSSKRSLLLATAVTLAAPLLLLAQAAQPVLPGGPGPAQPKEPPAVGTYKGELMGAKHVFPMTAGKNYIFKVKSRNFHPFVQIRDKTMQTINLTHSQVTNVVMVQPGVQEYHMQFAFTAPSDGDFNIILGRQFNGGIINGTMDYTVEVFTLKTIETIKDNLAETDPFFTLKGDCYRKVHTLELKAGVNYQIDLVSAKYQTYVVVEDPLGNAQCANGNNGGLNTSRVYFEPTKTGTYRLIATTTAPKVVGPYTLTVSEAPVGFAMAGPGGVVIGPPPPPNPNPPPANDDNAPKVLKGELKASTHNFTWVAGQRYMVGVKTENFQPYVRISKGAGTPPIWNHSGGTFNPQTKEWHTAFLYTATQNGEHSIEIANAAGFNNAVTLGYTLQVATLKTSLTKKDEITANDPIYPKKINCKHKVYTVAMKTGNIYEINAEGPINPFIYLEDSNGNLLTSNFAGGGNVMHARLQYTPTKDGDFKVIITTQMPQATGQFTLTVAEPDLQPAKKP